MCLIKYHAMKISMGMEVQHSEHLYKMEVRGHIHVPALSPSVEKNLKYLLYRRLDGLHGQF